MSYGPTGKRVIVREFAETPLQAIESFVEVVDQPPPDPAALQPSDVVIAVESAAVGWVDLLMSSGQYQHMAQPPYTPGLEYAGRVVWAGAEVNTAKVGDRVLADGLLTGPRSKGAYQRYGGFATYAVAPAEAALPLPDRLSTDQAVNLLGNYETAYHCLIARGRLQAGETVLIHGASGSTGLAAVHLAKIAGAIVIATGRSPEKLAIVKAQGADHVVCTREAPRFRTAVKELTQGAGVDVVYDGVGGEVSLETLRCVKFGARFLIVGWAATPFVAKGKGGRGAPNANQLPTNLLLMKGLDVLGCPTAIATHRDPTIRQARLAQILRWVHDGSLTPHVGEVYPFSQVREALLAKWESRHVGGCVLRPGS